MRLLWTRDVQLWQEVCITEQRLYLWDVLRETAIVNFWLSDQVFCKSDISFFFRCWMLSVFWGRIFSTTALSCFLLGVSRYELSNTLKLHCFAKYSMIALISVVLQPGFHFPFETVSMFCLEQSTFDRHICYGCSIQLCY